MPSPLLQELSVPSKNPSLVATNLKMNAFCLSRRETLSSIPSGAAPLALSQQYIPGEQAPFIQPSLWAASAFGGCCR